jgi:hypothetical protein
METLTHVNATPVFPNCFIAPANNSEGKWMTAREDLTLRFAK